MVVSNRRKQPASLQLREPGKWRGNFKEGSWGAATWSPGQDPGSWCWGLWEDMIRLLLPVLGKLQSGSSWCYRRHFRCYRKMSCWGDAYRNLKRTRKAQREQLYSCSSREEQAGSSPLGLPAWRMSQGASKTEVSLQSIAKYHRAEC